MPEDRKTQGLLKDMTVSENITITNLKRNTFGWFIKRKKETETVNSLVKKLKIRLRSIKENISNLSGGNQQKVILARWLDSNAKIIIFRFL